MEDNRVRLLLVTAIAPIAWGTNYYVTHEFLPPGYPLYGGVIRALPAGLLLLALARSRPRGDWWWKSLVLGVCNVGAFFALIYLASQLLPVSVASTIMSATPLTMSLFAWLLIGARPSGRVLLGAVAGMAGVCLMLGGGVADVRVAGVLASVVALTMSSCGYVLAKKWGRGGDLLATTAWQLVAGGLVLVPFAIVVEGAPPSLGLRAIGGFAYVVLVATAGGYVAWFTGLRRLDAATVGLVGLLNPVTGVLLGTTLAGDHLTVGQVAGLVLVLTGVTLGLPARTRAVRKEAVPDKVAR